MFLFWIFGVFVLGRKEQGVVSSGCVAWGTSIIKCPGASTRDGGTTPRSSLLDAHPALVAVGARIVYDGNEGDRGAPEASEPTSFGHLQGVGVGEAAVWRNGGMTDTRDGLGGNDECGILIGRGRE